MAEIEGQIEQDENKSVLASSPAADAVASPTRRDSDGLSPLFGPDDLDIESKILGRCGEAAQTSANGDSRSNRSLPRANGDLQKPQIGGARKGELVAGTAAAAAQQVEGANENLLAGFTILRLVQLLNLDVYYIGPSAGNTAGKIKRQKLSESRQKLMGSDTPVRNVEFAPAAAAGVKQRPHIEHEPKTDSQPVDEIDPLDELAQMNPLQKYVDSRSWLQSLCRLMRICLSLIAIMISVDKTISTIVLCLISRPDIKSRPGNIGLAYEASDVTMSWLVLILINLSSMYILFSTVFNGHLLWELLGQRLFLVGRRFQYSTMLSIIVFIYLEYIINISFINNLFGWSFETNEARPGLPSTEVNLHPAGGISRNHSLRDAQMPRQKGISTYNIHNSYSVLANLETFVTEKDEANKWLDILLTCFQFARGIIRVSPYITITYVTICLNEHVKTIRNQNLLTDSLKKKQKLRMVVKSRRAHLIGNAANAAASEQRRQHGNSSRPASTMALRARDTNSSSNSATAAAAAAAAATSARKKRVIFVTEASGTGGTSSVVSLSETAGSNSPRPLVTNLEVRASLGGRSQATPSPISMAGSSRCASSMSDWDSSIHSIGGGGRGSISPGPYSSGGGGSGGGGGNHFAHGRVSPRQRLYSMDDDCESGTSSMMATTGRNTTNGRLRYLSRIKNFDELETYITNLYIFTGRLNRLMSRQGLAMFFIVHNLVITSTLIVPEAISGGAPMIATIRLLVVLIGIVPFIAGQALNAQLSQLSKQIDRIIIQQQFIGRKRDNLVRIRELLHDIRVNCGGMLNFNVETGIKYLVVAFASAFFIEQEDYKLTRRH